MNSFCVRVDSFHFSFSLRHIVDLWLMAEAYCPVPGQDIVSCFMTGILVSLQEKTCCISDSQFKKRTCLTVRQRDTFLVNPLCQRKMRETLCPRHPDRNTYFLRNKKEETVLVSVHWKHTHKESTKQNKSESEEVLSPGLPSLIIYLE